MKINLVYNKNITDYKNSLENIETTLIKNNFEFRTFELNHLEDYGEFTFVLGGDGTLIQTAKFYSKSQIPVMGINIGRLGFLAQIEVKEFEKTLSKIQEGKYFVEERLMIESERLIALNDFVIKSSSMSRTSKFVLKINNHVVCDYIADGLIISTPTGSTAYGLSAGGPVLHPNIDAIAVIPICPHTLNARPLVVPASEKINIEACDTLLAIAVDGCNTMETLRKIEISAAQKKALLAFIDDTDFYSVLRNKLQWGTSPDSYRKL